MSGGLKRYSVPKYTGLILQKHVQHHLRFWPLKLDEKHKATHTQRLVQQCHIQAAFSYLNGSCKHCAIISTVLVLTCKSFGKAVTYSIVT